MRRIFHRLLVFLLLLLAASTPAFAVAKKVFSPAQLARMAGDWARMRPEAFFKKYPIGGTAWQRIKKETGAFPAKQKGIQPDEIAALKEDYFYVVAGLRKESAVLADHGIAYNITDTLRGKAEHTLDFPRSKGRTLGKVPKLPEAAVEDWMEVRAGEMKVGVFRKKWPKVRAGELAAVQDQAKAMVVVRSGTKGKMAASVMKLSAEEIDRANALAKPTAKIDEALIKKLRKEWPRVERKEISQVRLAQEVGIPIHQLQLYKQLHPGEFEIKTGLTEEQINSVKKRWGEVTDGTISVGKLLKEEGVGPFLFYAHKAEHEEDFPYAGKGRFQQARAATGKPKWSDEQLDEMKSLFGKFHRSELTQAQLHDKLRGYGINSPVARDYLKEVDEEAFSSRDDFLDRHADEIIDDIVELATSKRNFIRRWQDLDELVERNAELKAKWGPINITTKSWLVLRDRRGDKRLHKVLEQVNTRVGKPGPNGRRGKDEIEEAPAPPKGARGLASQLSERLAGQEPSKDVLLDALEELVPGESREQLWKRWLSLRDDYRGPFPELRRWNVDMRQPYSPRYVARWAMSMHEAGPGAPYDKIVEIFKRSPEYKEDGRVPVNSDEERSLGWISSRFPEMLTSPDTRATFQRQRRLIELMRTAPEGATVQQLLEQLKEIGYAQASSARLALERFTREDAERMGFDWKLVSQLGKKSRGLGQKKDDAFDPNAEPPGVDLKLARSILETPRIPPLLDFALQRLAKRTGTVRPFASNNVMFINHRYSDLVPFAETMIKAGMAPKNSVFVSTPYPFDDAVTYQLRKLGIDTMVPKQDMKSMEETVEKGIVKMLATYDDQAKRWNSPHPILILDDGGMAAKIISKKFQEHFHKFRIVEITAAGERIAKELEHTHGRLPFVYYSIAYSEAKKAVTSRFFATRVVDKTMKLIPQTGLALNNDKAVVRGGGPMGLFAAKHLRDEYDKDVVIIEPDATKAAMCRKAGFKVLEPEQALKGRGLVLGMSGYEMDESLLQHIDEDAIVVQGSSKRQEFPMAHVEERSSVKKELPRTDGLPQKSFTYNYKPKTGKVRRLHFLGDGWTINHDGSLAGTPIEDIQLELALVFESAVEAADTARTDTGKFRVLGGDLQEMYIDRWKAAKKKLKD